MIKNIIGFWIKNIAKNRINKNKKQKIKLHCSFSVHFSLALFFSQALSLPLPAHLPFFLPAS
jgi:hypothetical protein